MCIKRESCGKIISSFFRFEKKEKEEKKISPFFLVRAERGEEAKLSRFFVRSFARSLSFCSIDRGTRARPQPCSSSTGAFAFSVGKGREQAAERAKSERASSTTFNAIDSFFSLPSHRAFSFSHPHTHMHHHRIYSVLNSLGLYNKNAKILFFVREKTREERKKEMFFSSSSAAIDRAKRKRQ